MLRFALDHNFPAPIVATLSTLLRAELVPVSAIDPSWAELEDWQLFLALHRAPVRWDGLITNDRQLLSLAKEMTVLSQTNLTLIVAAGEGHNPVRAVGVLLCHLNHICEHSTPDRAQVWQLRVAQKSASEPHEFLEKIATREKKTVETIVRENRLPLAQVKTDRLRT